MRILARDLTSLLSGVYISNSVEDISQIVFIEDSIVLLLSNVESFSQVLEICSWELGRVLEWSAIVLQIVVVFNCFNNVSLTISLKVFFGNENMDIMEWHVESSEVASMLIKSSWVSESSLIVRNWPLWGGHHSQVVVQVWVQGAQQSVLGSEWSHSYCIYSYIKMYYYQFIRVMI